MLEKAAARPYPALYHDVSLLTDHDVYLFKEGSHLRLYEKLGAHNCDRGGERGVVFAVWAPNAESVRLCGDFNDWNRDSHPLRLRGDGSGIWEAFLAGLAPGARYKYCIRSRYGGFEADKGDPFAFYWERPPGTASVVWDLDHEWGDAQWMQSRAGRNALDAPFTIYETHLGSWRRVPEEGNRFLTYEELAQQLADYLHHMGYTHLECLPVMEHPCYGSWGYQTTGLFAPTARYGGPQGFMHLVDHLHQRGIGVLLDWVPSHVSDDAHGLAYFDGTHLFERRDPRRGYHPLWRSYNYGRYEVRSILLSSAMFWLDKYHVDGLRVDGVNSMLYLDYGRDAGDWVPNEFGGHEDLQAVDFLRKLNEGIYRQHPDVQTIADESTAWPQVSRPTYVGGLGFGMKWKAGWMHDTLDYFAHDPVHRKYHQDLLSSSIGYAFSENYVLPLPHDEVVYGKGSLVGKMPGDESQKLANLRALFGYMYGHPGKKLMFMGAEFAQRCEWQPEESLDWHLLEQGPHKGVQKWVRDLNHLCRSEPALHQLDFASEGYEWVDFHDADNSVISFLRKSRAAGDEILVVCNFTPVRRDNYIVGVPQGGWWAEMLNSDAVVYGGGGAGNAGGLEAAPIPAQGRYHSLYLTLPPLAVIFFKHRG